MCYVPPRYFDNDVIIRHNGVVRQCLTSVALIHFALQFAAPLDTAPSRHSCGKRHLAGTVAGGLAALCMQVARGHNAWR